MLGIIQNFEILKATKFEIISTFWKKNDEKNDAVIIILANFGISKEKPC